MSLYLLFGQYYDKSFWTSFEPEESSLNAPGTSSSSGAEPTAHWDSWGPEQPASPWSAVTFEQAASEWSAEPLEHQAVPLVPKAAPPASAPPASMLVAPTTPPGELPDTVAQWAEGNLAKLAQGTQGGTTELKAAKQMAEWAQGKVAELQANFGPKPPKEDPLQYFVKAQADVPLVIDR